MAAIGSVRASGASSRKITAVNTPAYTPLKRVRAPASADSAEREKLAAGAMPPKQPVATRASPSATNSRSGSIRSPERAASVLPIAQASIIPTSAIASAGSRSGRYAAGSSGGSEGLGSPCGISGTKAT